MKTATSSKGIMFHPEGVLAVVCKNKLKKFTLG
jgi:hypothetical protein